MVPLKHKPRKPTEEEKQQFLEWYLEKCRNIFKFSEEEIAAQKDLLTKDACVAVFDNYDPSLPYLSHNPGKIMMVIWPEGPETFNVFTWMPDGRLVAVTPYPLPK